jgi:two-component system chemotaxis response regulator CheY
LIVEDSKEDRSLIKYHLKKCGLQNIAEVSDGKSALELLQVEKVDLIIADRYMPEMDGLSFFKKLQEDKALAKIPFLLITAEYNSDKVVETLELGIRDYLIKPYDPVIMVDKIKRMLGVS